VSQRPAACFGLAPQKGQIAVGAHADFVCVDADIEWRVEPDWLVSNSGFSLFNGRALRGRPIHSTVRGRWVLRDGVLASEGGGRLV
jgi:dihydroorotase-like cyclic amidohydrolase